MAMSCNNESVYWSKFRGKKRNEKFTIFTCYKEDIKFIRFSVHATHELINQVGAHAVTAAMHVNNNLILKQSEKLKSSPVFSEAQACCYCSTHSVLQEWKFAFFSFVWIKFRKNFMHGKLRLIRPAFLLPKYDFYLFRVMFQICKSLSTRMDVFPPLSVAYFIAVEVFCTIPFAEGFI